MGHPAQKLPKLPPMLSQYLEYKEQYSDCLLIFQVGDFYEIFFEDAEVVARFLNITLTSRDKNSENPIPMCGVPVAVVDGYIDRLVDGGFSVAVVSQTSTPVAGKKMVDRSLERIITPGVRVLGTSESESGGVVIGIYPGADNDLALAISDVQTGVVKVCDGFDFARLIAEVQRIDPAEIVLPTQVETREISRRLRWVRELEARIPACTFKFRTESFYQGALSSSREFAHIPGYSSLSSASRRAVRLLINFVDETTVNSLLAISRVEVHSEQGRVEIDATTRRNLELVQTLRDGRVEGSLFHFLDRATTVGGKRLLREWLIRPLSDQMAIRCRHDAVETLCGSIDITKEISEVLRRFSDLERCAARIDLGIISPKELAAMRDSLGLLHDIQEALARVEKRSIGSSQELQRISQDLYAPAEVQELLDGVLVESPPYVLHEGGIFCDGHHEELDRYRMIRKDGRSWIAQLEAREREATGISSLKIKFNNAMGYFFEVTRANAEKVPEHYTRRQTMTNASRFITEELKNQEEEILGAKGAQIALEKRLFDELRQALLPFAARLREIYRSVATLDVLMSFALIADAQDYCRPTMVSTRCLSIDQGRHPVLAQLLEGRFVPNSLSLNADETSCVVLTGANMGGKSTFLRQAALITLLAHCGSFIPAKEATIGVVDKIFARLGASDDMAEGESTFMVEMREASHILASATENSLVLIDEIGRGTATADGLAIAQSILEWIVKEIGCLTLFATHFHELTDLESRYPHIGNFSVGSVDRGGEVHFTHQICRGAANRSYGLEVARLAALPEDVLARARALLSDFQRSGQVVNSQQLSFFEPTPAVAREVAPTIPEDYDFLKNLQKELQEIDINNLTPLEALTLLEKFRNKST